MLNRGRCWTREAQCSETSEQAVDVVVAAADRFYMLDKGRCWIRTAQCSETEMKIQSVLKRGSSKLQ